MGFSTDKRRARLLYVMAGRQSVAGCERHVLIQNKKLVIIRQSPVAANKSLA